MGDIDIGDLVRFIDEEYVKDYFPARQYLYKSGIVLDITLWNRGKPPLLTFYTDEGVFSAYIHRFLLVKKNPNPISKIAHKINEMYERQPYKQRKNHA